MYAIYFKDWQGEWQRDKAHEQKTYETRQAAARRAAYVKKNFALNGQMTVQQIGVKADPDFIGDFARNK